MRAYNLPMRDILESLKAYQVSTHLNFLNMSHINCFSMPKKGIWSWASQLFVQKSVWSDSQDRTWCKSNILVSLKGRYKRERSRVWLGLVEMISNICPKKEWSFGARILSEEEKL